MQSSKDTVSRDQMVSINAVGKLFPGPSDMDRTLAEKLKTEGVIQTKFHGQIPTDGDLWSCGPLDNRTWRWTLHAFLPLDPLIAVGDWDVVLSHIAEWSSRFGNAPVEADFPWHDHATALRLDRLSRIALQMPTEQLMPLAARHATLLLEESFYSRHTNHGFDQALSLMLASLAFPHHPESRRWQQIGVARLDDEIRFAFTSEGVHVENSPAYHMGMISNLNRARRLLHAVGDQAVLLGFDKLFDQALRFLAWVTRPDRFVCYLGDSVSYRPNVPAELADLPGFAQVRYVATAGREGSAPSESFIVYQESGYAIYRSRWSPWERHTHIMMKCGFLSRYHRQDDDLNVLVHAHGEDWLIDSGLYNHNHDDPVRIYMRSARAHNVPFVPGAKVNRSTPDADFATLEPLSRDDFPYAVQGMTRMYAGMRMVRQLLIKDENNFRLVDKILSSKDSSCYWLFHVPLDKKISIGANTCRVVGKQMSLVISSSERLNCEVQRGFAGRFPSVTSVTVNQLEDSQVIVFGPATVEKVAFSFRFQSKE
ncbi:ubiquinone menaquinone biosynthesis methylase [Herbaspirillum frisingense GSF30]|uniref:Ubiquinone menaquinone biosynthesis methylase n=2 Tax=Herbaspirillum frisingense TaxID=92645 RepID=A0AAI9IFE8_9BURK|nr:ubiquinone menaquinone biosynthesis methylase [Herbaspirillum frisingense GSF30]